MPTRLCAEPRCPNPATYRGRCPGHARTNNANIQRAGHNIYRTKRWQHIRRRVLFEQPLCPGVFGEACGEIASHVDHITPLPDGDPWARSNLQGLCVSCHAAKTRREQQVK